jgi:hypothetical protein
MTSKSFIFEADIISSLETLARDRCDVKRGGGVSNRRIDQRRTDFEIDYLGVQAEFCFSLLFDVDMHHIPGALSGDRGKFDYIIEDVTFGVKGAFSNAQYLLVPKHQYPVSADVLVMFKQISRRMMTCPGYTTGEHFMENHVWKDLGYGADAVMHHSDLKPIQELVDVIAESRDK